MLHPCGPCVFQLFEGVKQDVLLPYLDPIVQWFSPPGDPMLVWRYVQAHSMKTLAMVADVSEVIFAKARPLAVYALDGSHHSSLS